MRSKPTQLIGLKAVFPCVMETHLRMFSLKSNKNYYLTHALILGNSEVVV